MPTDVPVAAIEAVQKLVQQYSLHRDSYEDDGYNEENARATFIGPLFEALGWDVRNGGGAAERFRDVVLNVGIQVRDNWKVPDYTFRIGGTRVFFVEAKKPALDLEQLPDPALQLRGYARAVDLPVSILTNFRQFAVYDTAVRPKRSDKASAARVLLFRWTELASRFEELWNLLSRPAVISGALDRYAQRPARARGIKEIDDDFLADLDQWRRGLAAAFMKSNPELGEDALRQAVQSTLNRIVFLRFAEGRDLEPFGQLRDLARSSGNYNRLTRLCRDADKRYNSGLFDLEADELTPALKLDDGVLRKLIKKLYYPDSPYVFSAMAPEVLGHAYERFLANVIELSATRKPRITKKPEAKKSGGVYYTPAYVVKYIVSKTVGELCRDKSPKALEKLAILDPACGSGSFLLGALDFLFEHYLDWYRANNPKKWHGQVANENGTYRLTTAEKGRIARTHLFGVDIDPQAVEVAKLSLLLKIIEGESAASIEQQIAMFHERALPALEENIQCGNSLVGDDYFVKRGHPATASELDVIRPFSWNRRFAAILKRGGFDLVIGNPPYLNVDDTWGKGDTRLAALKAIYPDVYNDKTDILYYFLARGLALAKESMCFIVSRAFLEGYKADRLRSVLGSHVEEIVDFQNYPVFKGVGISTCVLSTRRSSDRKTAHVFRLRNGTLPTFDLVTAIKQNETFERITVARDALRSEPWNFVSTEIRDLNAKIDAAGERLDRIVGIGQGMQTGLNSIFGERSIEEIRKWKVPGHAFFLRASNSDIESFSIRKRGEYLLYVEGFDRFSELPRGVQKFFDDNARELKNRAAFKRGNCEWWKYTWPLHRERYFRDRRILCPFISPRNRFALDAEDEFISLTDTTVLFAGAHREDVRYLLGLLNSAVLTFRFRSIGKLKGGDQYEYFWNSVSRLPIRRIDFQNKDDVRLHGKIVELVDSITDLKKSAGSASPTVLVAAEDQAAALREELDEAVAKLYGLTKSELTSVRSEIPDQ